MNEALAPSRREFLLYETTDGILRFSVRVEVDCGTLPVRPMPVTRKKEDEDAA